MASLTVVAGPMFSGKTKALINWVHNLRHENIPVLVLKPEIDTRYSKSDIVSHDGIRIAGRLIPSNGNYEIDPVFAHIAIDEAQFLSDEDAQYVVQESTRKDVFVAGLDLDAKANPFGPMPTLLSYATSVVKLTATCSQCGSNASRSQRLTDNSVTVLVGGAECYEPRCVTCFRA